MTNRRAYFIAALLVFAALAVFGATLAFTAATGSPPAAKVKAAVSPGTGTTTAPESGPGTAPDSPPAETPPEGTCFIHFDLPEAGSVNPDLPDNPDLPENPGIPERQQQQEGSLFAALPLPETTGEVFAGWYSTPEAAASLTQQDRINGSRIATCPDGNLTLYGAWVNPSRVVEEDANIPILMYHQFTTNPEGEDNWLRDNYAYIGDFESHLAYIQEQQFYLPTWQELNAFLDGKLFLPSHSVIVTDDDADQTWVQLAAPLAEKYQIPVTSFVIGIDGPGPELSQFVWKRSHTYDMHSAGDNGQGRMVNWSVDQIAADLLKSAEVVGGTKEVVAYPYGHNNEAAHAGLTQAGFDLGRTVDPGYVTRETSKFELPVIRINYGMGVDALAAAIS